MAKSWRFAVLACYAPCLLCPLLELAALYAAAPPPLHSSTGVIGRPAAASLSASVLQHSRRCLCICASFPCLPADVSATSMTLDIIIIIIIIINIR